MTRIISALTGIALVTYLVLFAGNVLFVSAVVLVALVALSEFYKLTRKRQWDDFCWLGYAMAAGILIGFCHPQFAAYKILAVTCVIVLLFALFSGRPPKEAVESAIYTLFGVLYLGGLMGYLIAIRNLDYSTTGKILTDIPQSEGPHELMFLFVVIWINDIFAFIVGKLLGRHKLASTISPNKTVEGAIGGLLFGVLAGIVYTKWMRPGTSLNPIVLSVISLSLVIGIFSQLGDLCESQIKRAAGVKDSGWLFPGHGGVLDRIDSLLFGAPALYYYVSLVHHL
jgi:phosphatidate cytidylyltransferase